METPKRVGTKGVALPKDEIEIGVESSFSEKETINWREASSM